MAKLDDYLTKKEKKKQVPARIREHTIERGKLGASKKGVPFCEFVDSAINMAADQAKVK